MKTVACFGEVLIDFQPVPDSTRSLPPRFEQHAGGAPANVAVAIAALGGKAEFIGMLSNDPFGNFLLDSLQRAGVGTKYVQRTSAAPTALAFVTLDEKYERHFSFYRPPAADLLFRESRLSANAFKQTAVFHTCSNSLTEEGIALTTLACMKRARKADALVSFDMNLRPALWPDGVNPAPRIWKALALADVVKLSTEELSFLAASAGSEADAMKRIFASHAQLVLVTDGANPLRWMSRNSSGQLETFSVRTIDSTAAGDAFTGGLIFALLGGDISPGSLSAMIADTDEFTTVLRFASACGALATTRRGAFLAMPSRAEVEALICSDLPERLKVASS